MKREFKYKNATPRRLLKQGVDITNWDSDNFEVIQKDIESVNSKLKEPLKYKLYK